MSENRAKKAFLSIGSNLGNKINNIEKAKFFLNSSTSIKILKVSSYYRTASWPDKSKPFFLNIVVQIRTTFDPLNLFDFIKKIEKSLGRKKTKKNYPRTCDIDILDYDQKKIYLKSKENELVIPHPRLHNRNFVLLPLFEISKRWKHPKLSVKITKLIKSIGSDNLRSIKVL